MKNRKDENIMTENERNGSERRRSMPPREFSDRPPVWPRNFEEERGPGRRERGWDMPEDPRFRGPRERFDGRPGERFPGGPEDGRGERRRPPMSPMGGPGREMRPPMGPPPMMQQPGAFPQMPPQGMMAPGYGMYMMPVMMVPVMMVPVMMPAQGMYPGMGAGYYPPMPPMGGPGREMRPPMPPMGGPGREMRPPMPPMGGPGREMRPPMPPMGGPGREMRPPMPPDEEKMIFEEKDRDEAEDK